MMMPHVEECIRSQMNVEELVLEDMQISSLAPYVEILSQMPRLRVLRLAHNHLVDLPNDLSGLALVETLDISHNPILGADAVMNGLASMPQLRQLAVHFQDQKDEDAVIISLMALQSFNGTYLGGEEEGVLDGHPIGGPALRHHASDNGHKGVAVTNPVTAGPDSAMAMPAATTTATATTSDSDRAWMDADALHQAVSSGLPVPVQSAEPYPAFKERVVRYLHLLTAAEREPEVQAGEVLKARRVLADYSLEELLAAAEAASASSSQQQNGLPMSGEDKGSSAAAMRMFPPAFVHSLRAIQQHYASLLDDYDRHWRQMAQQQERRTAAMRGELADALEEVEGLIAAAKQQRRGAATTTMPSFRDATADMAVAPGPTQHTTVTSGAFSGQVKALGGRGRSTGPAATSSTQREPGSRAEGAAPPTGAAARRSVSRSSARPHSVSNSNSNKKVLTLRQLLDMIDNIYHSKEKYDQRCAAHELPHETMEQHMYTYLNQRYGLREIIVEYATAIIEGVKRYAVEQNEVAVFAKILRNDVDEGFRTVQQQIRTTVPELLRFHLKEKHPGRSDQDIQALVRQRMEADGELLEQEWTFIAEYMYAPGDAAFLKELVLQDIERQRVPPAISTRFGAAAAPAPAPARSRKYSYHSFIRLLLDFQLDGHERFLAPFVRIFRRHDGDGDGVINREELLEVIREVVAGSGYSATGSGTGVLSEEVEGLACQIFDRCAAETCELMTFSEAVGILGEEIAMLGAAKQE